MASEFGIPEEASDTSKSEQERLDIFRSSLSTATSLADIDGIILTRLIIAFAKEQEYDAIIWGDSDSRLAAKALANVAKGRGYSLAWEICDGVSPWGIQFNFPLRDLFKSELELYASLIMSDLPFSSVIDASPSVTENLTNRNMSIEALMTQYVETQGEKYPGVMANIVRTIDKLRPPTSDSNVKCVLCGMPVECDAEEAAVLGNSLVDSGSNGTEQPNQITCYGCTRSCADIRQLIPAR